jgi:transcriptional regulator with XRE-family HTH domain
VASIPGKWQVDGARLRALRMAKLWTVPELATKAGVGERTLTDLEAGRRGARADTVRVLARALAVAPEDLVAKPAPAPAAPATPPVAPARAEPAPPIAIPPAKQPAQTRLDVLADLVRARGLSRPPALVGKAKVAVLDPVVMQNLFARHAAFEGQSFVVEGRIERQRALSVAEARALKTRVGVGARYRVVVEVMAGEALDVTLHAVDRALAGALQEKMGQPVRVVAQVRVVAKDDARVVSLFASARKRAWALVATRVVATVR